MIFEGHTDEQVLEMAREDFRAASASRREIEDRKVRDYRLYRRFREALTGGGIHEEDKGPHGWSKITIPLVFWIVETILPRIGVQPPTLTATASNPDAVPYAQAKQLRLQRQLKRGYAEEELLLSLKQFLILGDGPVKTPWDAWLRGPRILAIDWFDWFISPDARRWHDAEVLWHRTWHTRRDIEALIERDSNRIDPLTGDRSPPLYDHDALERLIGAGAYRETLDETYTERREAAGLGPQTHGQAEGQVALCEGWYRDGSMVMIAGDDEPVLPRIEREPVFKDKEGRPLRPFSVLQNTPDLFMPYSISDAEMLEDHQHEATTLRNAGIDQATGNMNAPKGINRQMVRGEDVRAAWEEPNGTFEVDGPPDAAVVQFPPQAMSPDFERVYEMIRSEAQMVSGVSDISAGQPTSFGLDNSTATGMAIIREEANQRYRMKLKLIQLGLNRVARNFDALDRAISMTAVDVPVSQGFQVQPGAKGIRMVGDAFAQVSPAVNGRNLDYEIEVDAGSMAPPHQLEQAQKMRALLGDLSHPAAIQMVNWPEVVRMLVEAHGHQAEKILLPPGPGSVTGPGPGPGGLEPPGPGEEPVGPLEPLEGTGPPGGQPIGGNGRANLVATPA